MNNEGVWDDARPWHPEKDAVRLKHLGKLAEELNECGAAVSRCIIQGIDEKRTCHWRYQSRVASK